ncbi:hypothetical protein F0562_007771 [Nyssa sinensis]|uniref:Uncharacterized protein n=1 Tax=Nyssa sinensis TaxID=561372 RepID=A0A5J5A7A1_9ASTE|nr:hypothetical protein F0562_007771 [Nyssa sinensis]
MEARKQTSRTVGQGQLYCSGGSRAHPIDVHHHRHVAKAVLVQFWTLKAAPDGRQYLVTTSDRIFRLSKYDEGLFRYWAHCRSRDYFVDGGPEAVAMLAWTQEAWHRSTEDHPELNHALHFALPVVEPSSTSAQHSQSHCVVGLLEIVVMPNYKNSGYAEADEEVTKILEALEVCTSPSLS